MKILGINISHHMSYCYMDGGVIKKFHNEERSMGIKHFYPTQLNIDKLKGIKKFENIVFDCVVFASFGNIAQIIEYSLAKLCLKKLQFKKWVFVKEHHMLHAISALFHSKLSQAVAIVRDGGGWPFEGSYHRETDTIWKIDKNKCEPIFKHYSNYTEANYWRVYEVEKHKTFSKNNVTFSSDCVGGQYYSLRAKEAGFGEEYGQFMGLAPYGEIETKHENIEYHKVEKAMDAQQKTFEEACNLIERYCSDTKNIVLSGGYFLNCLNNFKLVKEFPEINFFVDPIPHDAGIAVGAALYYENY